MTWDLIDRLQQVVDTHLPYLDGRPPMTYGEAAETLGVSTKWLQRRVNAGTIPHVRMGRFVRFLPQHVREIREARVRGTLR